MLRTYGIINKTTKFIVPAQEEGKAYFTVRAQDATMHTPTKTKRRAREQDGTLPGNGASQRQK